LIDKQEQQLKKKISNQLDINPTEASRSASLESGELLNPISKDKIMREQILSQETITNVLKRYKSYPISDILKLKNMNLMFISNILIFFRYLMLKNRLSKLPFYNDYGIEEFSIPANILQIVLGYLTTKYLYGRRI
jgi:hypothetical protein